MYFFIYCLVLAGFKALFRNMHIHGLEKLPKDKPMILASNHPNSFLDGVVHSHYFKYPIYSLARGDVFNNPIAKKLMYSVNMRPIWRATDAKNSSEKNAQTFAAVTELFNENGVVVIFPEGICVIEKRLRSIKKGTARMAQYAFENSTQKPLDLYIVPIGINYTKPAGVRQEVYINIQDPIPYSEYLNQMEENSVLAINGITNRIEEHLQQSVIHIENPKNDNWVEEILTALRNKNYVSPFQYSVFNNKKFQVEKTFTDNLNTLEKTNPEKAETVLNNIKKYTAVRKKLGFSIGNLLPKSNFSLFQLVYLIALLPVFIPVFSIGILPFLGIQKLTYSKIKSNVFHLSVIAGGTIFATFFMLLILSLVLFAINISYGLIFLGVFIGGGYLSIIYLEYWLNLKQWWQQITNKSKPEYKEALQLFNSILQDVNG